MISIKIDDATAPASWIANPSFPSINSLLWIIHMCSMSSICLDRKSVPISPVVCHSGLSACILQLNRKDFALPMIVLPAKRPTFFKNPFTLAANTPPLPLPVLSVGVFCFNV